MIICYFGTYDINYTRNKLLIKGLRQNGVEVIECRTPQIKNKLKKYWQLIKKHSAIKDKYDVMLVGFAGHAIMPLAWLLAKLNGKKIIFDVFLSEYDSVILDRQEYPKLSLQAFKFWFMDWLSCTLADKILIDAQEHVKYFVKTYKIPVRKFKMIFVSCDPEFYQPQDKQGTNEFIVHFHGSYSPVQGVEHIVQAAKLLAKENVTFNLNGKLGNYWREIELNKKLGNQNVNFIDFVPYEELAKYIAKSDICLGMFGDSARALHSSAFKIVEAMAVKKAVVTGNTASLREMVVDDQSGLLCKLADPQDLADKILKLKNDSVLRQKLAANGHQFYLKHLTPQATAAELVKFIQETIFSTQLFRLD